MHDFGIISYRRLEEAQWKAFFSILILIVALAEEIETANKSLSRQAQEVIFAYARQVSFAQLFCK
jgi:hypothetical protein